MTQNCSILILELGIGILNDNKELILSKKFDVPVSSYRAIKNGDYSEILEFIDSLRSFKNIFSNVEGLVFQLRNLGLDIYFMKEEYLKDIIENKLHYLVRCKFAENESEAIKLLRKFAIDFSSINVKDVSQKLDLHVIQSINALDELDKIINVIGARMREWYGLHFPELDHLIQNISTYAHIVRIAGQRENIGLDLLTNLGIEERRSEFIVDAARRSKGGDITDENLLIIKKLADEVINQTELRKILTIHVDSTMEAIAPNVKDLLTASVGARIISKAGSINKLAIMPASTIQILGAEKALFRSLKTGARPPKHGILFQHPIIHSAPKWQRGKIARAVAAKVAIAARVDVYRSAEKVPVLLETLNNRIIEIQQKYKEPTTRYLQSERQSMDRRPMSRDRGGRGGGGDDRFDHRHSRRGGFGSQSRSRKGGKKKSKRRFRD